MLNISHKSLYEQIGGEVTINKLVEAFYPRVYAAPELIPLFAGDIEEIKRKQRWFLTQFLGGPALYTEAVGFTNMKKMHMDFEITQDRAQAWLRCMSEAMDEIGLEGQWRELFYSKLFHVSQVMINTPS